MEQKIYKLIKCDWDLTKFRLIKESQKFDYSEKSFKKIIPKIRLNIQKRMSNKTPCDNFLHFKITK